MWWMWFWLVPYVIAPNPVVDVGGVKMEPEKKPEQVASEYRDPYTCPRCHRTVAGCGAVDMVGYCKCERVA